MEYSISALLSALPSRQLASSTEAQLTISQCLAPIQSSKDIFMQTETFITFDEIPLGLLKPRPHTLFVKNAKIAKLYCLTFEKAKRSMFIRLSLALGQLMSPIFFPLQVVSSFPISALFFLHRPNVFLLFLLRSLSSPARTKCFPSKKMFRTSSPSNKNIFLLFLLFFLVSFSDQNTRVLHC